MPRTCVHLISHWWPTTFPWQGCCCYKAQGRVHCVSSVLPMMPQSRDSLSVCVCVCVCLIDWSYLLSYPFAAAFLSFFPSLRVHENRIFIISWSGCLWTKSIHTLCNTRDTEPVTARQSVKSEETSQWSVLRLDIKINSQCIRACNHTQAPITKKTSYKIACGFRPINCQNEAKFYFIHHSKNNKGIFHLREKSLQWQV